MSNITIYFKDKPVFLCDEITSLIDGYRHHPDTVFIDELSTSAINSLLHEIGKAQLHAGILYDTNFLKLKKSFFKHFTLIKAAGGVVKNNKGEILLMFRLGKWDLPKGKLDDNETISECAKREVQEETGIKNLEITESIGSTFHTYTQFGKHILKETQWFAMNATGNEDFIPQTEEDITQIIWVKKSDLEKYFLNSYPAIVDILKKS
jgi:8-oxo-dGTP pyrophosphatase MutT (NUDIX family)